MPTVLEQFETWLEHIRGRIAALKLLQEGFRAFSSQCSSTDVENVAKVIGGIIVD